MKKLILALVATITGGATAAFAAETINYVYDAHGRLVQVVRTGSVNKGVTTTYNHDKADNRTAKTTSGAPT